MTTLAERPVVTVREHQCNAGRMASREKAEKNAGSRQHKKWTYLMKIGDMLMPLREIVWRIPSNELVHVQKLTSQHSTNEQEIKVIKRSRTICLIY